RRSRGVAASPSLSQRRFGYARMCNQRRLLMNTIYYARKSTGIARHRRRLALMWFALAVTLGGCTASSRAQDPPAQIDSGVTYWPVALDAAEGRVEVYQPQPEAMKGDTLTARAAVSLRRPGASSATFGAVWFTAHAVTDRDTRTV